MTTPPQRPVGVAWAPEPVHWSEVKRGDVIEVGDRLAIVARTGVHEGRRWLSTFDMDQAGVPTERGQWAPDDDPDPLALVLVRRDALIGEVINDG